MNPGDEFVFNGYGMLLTDPLNAGTYNFAHPTNEPIGHGVLDVVPYFILGNSPNDPTSFWDRVTATHDGRILE